MPNESTTEPAPTPAANTTVAESAGVPSQIMIGGDDWLKKELASCQKRADGSESAEDRAQQKFRVMVGTLLKMDNVSFLLGAGCSKDAGGVLFRKVPLKIEKALLQAGKWGRGNRSWLNSFYAGVAIHASVQAMDEKDDKCKQELKDLAGTPPTAADRRKLLDSYEDNVPGESSPPKPLPVAFEGLASTLLTLETAACGAGSLRVGAHSFALTDLHELNSQLRRCLFEACQLPVAGKKGALDTYEHMLLKVLTRPPNLRRPAFFTLNYDTLVEQAADNIGVTVVDGFVGTQRRVFRPESFDRDFYFPAQTTEGKVHRLDRVIHLYKLHGSVTWERSDETFDNPFGLCSAPDGPKKPGKDVVIYPTPLKYGATLGLPYSEMFRRFGQTTAQPQSVLFVIGYNFGDAHVNAVIRQALAIPSFTLVIVSPSAGSWFVQELENAEDRRIWIVRGELGKFEEFVKRLLPDLRDEDVTRKVVATYRAVDPSYREAQREPSNEQ